MAKSPLEYKSLGVEFKAAEGDKGEYEGYFSIFGNVDDGMDVILNGAFTKSIQERGPGAPGGNRIQVLYAHDWDKLIGPPPDVLKEDSTGLYAKGHLTLDSFWGRETWALMKDGALKEGSIGFIPISARVAYLANGVRNIGECKLYEISPVPLGMNPLTTVAAVKALWAAGGVPDDEVLDTLFSIGREIKAGRMLSAANQEKLKAAHDACATALEHMATLLAAATPEDEAEKAALLHLAQTQAAQTKRARLLELGRGLRTL